MTIQDVFSLLREGERLDPARVEPITAEVRSGVNFLFRDARKRGVPADEQEVIESAIAAGTLLASFVVEWGYDVPHEQAEEFRRWLLDNEERLAGCAPPGVHYRGTYALSVGSERSSGVYRTIWAFQSFNAIQDLGGTVGDAGSEFAMLLNELSRFRDRARGAPETAQFYVPAAGAYRL